VSTVSQPPRGIGRELQMDEEIGEPVDGASVRYWRAADGTLQFLPGRLEIAAGRDAGQEIRFVRTSGPDGTCVTFGRADGPPYRHVQLREPTVSRTHARMALEPVESPNTVTRGSSGAGAARWRLENLSATNPVIVNGRPLDASGDMNSSVILSDGDRIEMGEVAFVFRER
jgi:pSer/pThr/pTyr-binding forkhead associated (FHA) protein